MIGITLKKKRLACLIMLTILLLITNLCVKVDKAINKKNHPFYKGYNASYSDLYSPKEVHAIAGFKITTKGEMAIELSPTPSNSSRHIH